MTTCPYCKYKATQHEELEDKGNNPKIGDSSFCINCGDADRKGTSTMLYGKCDDTMRLLNSDEVHNG